MITRDDVEAAAERVSGRVRRTPVLTSSEPDGPMPAGGVLKLELLQHTGTFKARGAFNRILAARDDGSLDPAAGVVVASGGNAGLANAYAAGQLGLPATVYVPETSSPTKVRRLREYGATVVARGAEYADALAAAEEHVARTPALYIHAYDQLEIVAGAGTLALELEEQVHTVDTVLVACGGGGLMGGVAAALEGRAQLVAVEPVTAPTLHEALNAGAPVDVTVSGVAADSLGARRIGRIGFHVARRAGVASVLVEDDDLVAARRVLWERYRVAVEHGAAAAMAALTSGAYRPAEGERVAVVLCGANTDPSDLAS